MQVCKIKSQVPDGPGTAHSTLSHHPLPSVSKLQQNLQENEKELISSKMSYTMVHTFKMLSWLVPPYI